MDNARLMKIMIDMFIENNMKYVILLDVLKYL